MKLSTFGFLGLAISWLCGSASGADVARDNAGGQPVVLAYAPAPPDNPLKGFVPYLRADTTFPHSLEWDYTKLSDVMTGPTNFNWAPFDAKLNAAASRGHQFIARFYLEWPGKTTGVPQYLIAAGLTMRTWTNTNTQPFPPAVDHTPDYEDPRLRAALTNFIHALGRRYDGDPRLGFVGLGLLGHLGRMAQLARTTNGSRRRPCSARSWTPTRRRSSKTQAGRALSRRYRTTPLCRQPPPAPSAITTIRSPGPRCIRASTSDAWFFETRLRAAGALDKWRTQPIGGEVRPEVWPCLFDEPSCAPKGQEFDRCVAVTHASWLCNEGVFRGKLQGAARERAIAAARRLGYELHVASAETPPASRDGVLPSLTVTNTGVAPFYYDWPVELGVLNSRTQLVATWKPDWKLSGIVPARRRWPGGFQARSQPSRPAPYRLLLRAVNPLPNGSPLRFANQTQDRHLPGWLTLGAFQR